MPQVPYTGAQSVEPNYPATPNVHPNANPEAFGAATAAASARFGVSLEAAADSIFNRAYSMQQLDQQADAINAHAAASDQIGKLVMDYRTLSGKAAKDGYEPFVQNVDKIVDEQAKGLSSDYAKKLYLNETRVLRTRTVESAGLHAGHEFKNYLIGTEQANADNARTIVGMNPEDDEVFNEQLKRLSGSAKSMGAFQGYGEAETLDWYNKQTSAMVYDRAKILARTDPMRAKEVLDDAVSRGLIDGAHAGEAGSFIRNQRNQVMTRVESAKLLDGEGAHFGVGKVGLPRAREGIAAVESSGNYDPPHPTVTKGQYAGQHALGRYGIMQGNLAPWLKEAGMKPMTEAEFLKDHEAQDKLFDFKFGQLMEEHGSANKAAMVWFTGKPDPDMDANDGHSTAPEYLKKFNAALAKTATGSEIDSVADSRAKSLDPDDPDFHVGFRDRVTAEHNRMRSIEREDEFNRRQTVESALGPGPDGKLPTSIESIQDPKVREAWDNLNPTDRRRYEGVFARNAKGDYAPTQQNQIEYRTWLGRLTDPMASDEDRKKAIEADYSTMPLPANQRQQLVTLRGKLFSNQQKNPALNHAMQVLTPMLDEAGFTRRLDEESYYQFIGALHLVMEDKFTESGKPPNDEEIKTMGTRLLQEQVTKSNWGWIFDGKEAMFKTPIPENIKENLISSWAAKHDGATPSERTLQSYWAAMQYKKLYSKPVKQTEARNGQ
jgi:hypothetical protein